VSGVTHHGLIVVGVDGSAGSQRAVEWAASEGARRHARLRVSHVLDDPFLPADALTAESPTGARVVAAAKALVAETTDMISGKWPEVTVTSSLRLGKAGRELLRSADGADLLVVGSHGHSGLVAAALGSVSTYVAAHAEIPTAVVSSDAGGVEDRPHGQVVVGVDGSAASSRAVGFAFDAASQLGRELIVAHAVWDPMTESMAVVSLLSHIERVAIDDTDVRAIAETVAGWREEYPDVRTSELVFNGRPAHVLEELSTDAGLMVVGTRGRSGLATLGSVSLGVLRKAHCPVVVVPGR